MLFFLNFLLGVADSSTDMVNCIINAMTDKANKPNTGLHLVSLIINNSTVFDDVNSVLQKAKPPLPSYSMYYLYVHIIILKRWHMNGELHITACQTILWLIRLFLFCKTSMLTKCFSNLILVILTNKNGLTISPRFIEKKYTKTCMPFLNTMWLVMTKTTFLR